MTEGGRRAAAREELALSEEELRAARQLIAAGSHRVAVTRVYYAVFHALRACLFTLDVEPRTHEGVVQQFGQHFVKTGRFEAATSRLVTRLQKYREEADYSRSFVIDEPGVREEMDAAAGLIDRIRAEVERALA